MLESSDITKLPKELFPLIMQHLDFKTFTRLFQTSKLFNQVIEVEIKKALENLKQKKPVHPAMLSILCYKAKKSNDLKLMDTLTISPYLLPLAMSPYPLPVWFADHIIQKDSQEEWLKLFKYAYFNQISDIENRLQIMDLEKFNQLVNRDIIYDPNIPYSVIVYQAKLMHILGLRPDSFSSQPIEVLQQELQKLLDMGVSFKKSSIENHPRAIQFLDILQKKSDQDNDPMLLETANINGFTEEGHNILFNYLYGCDEEIADINIILDVASRKNFNINIKRVDETILIFLARNNLFNPETAEILRRFKNLNVNITDYEFNTALYYTVKNNNPLFTKFLLEYDHINVNMSGRMSDAPIIEAVSRSHPEIVSILIEHPTFDFTKNPNILHYAISFYINKMITTVSQSATYKEIIILLSNHPEIDLTYKNTLNLNVLEFFENLKSTSIMNDQRTKLEIEAKLNELEQILTDAYKQRAPHLLQETSLSLFK